MLCFAVFGASVPFVCALFILQPRRNRKRLKPLFFIFLKRTLKNRNSLVFNVLRVVFRWGWGGETVIFRVVHTLISEKIFSKKKNFKFLV